ncbi:MAG: hypothetical protein U0R50_15375 [Gaiellales bacterium]
MSRQSRLTFALAAAAGALALCGPALAGGPGMALGAAEDAVRAGDLVQAQSQLTMLSLAGMSSVRITSNWLPGLTAPTEQELGALRNVEAASQLTGVRVFVSIYSPGSKTTPLTPEAQLQFAQYSAALVQALPTVDDVIVANEPNLNRFWLPQFNPDGTNASAPAYLTLLAQTYDAVKAVDPGARIWGGATSPRGSDRPDGARQTSSPTGFITALGAAYRASGRVAPIMDGYSHHPYPDNSSQSPDFAHPKTTTIGLADYEKLVSLLGTAFDGTAQQGSTLPILYDEFGIESVIPSGKTARYTGAEPATTKPVDETTQAAFYQRALQLVFCQPNVAGMLLFHTVDEDELPAWQSGVYYADGSPKASLVAVRDALRRTKGGSIARCPGLALEVTAPKVKFPAAAAFKRGVRTVKFTCSLDCIWQLRSVRAADGIGTARVRGYGRAGEPVIASLQGRKLGAQPVKLVLSLLHPVNPGAEWTRTSAPLATR